MIFITFSLLKILLSEQNIRLLSIIYTVLICFGLIQMKKSLQIKRINLNNLINLPANSLTIFFYQQLKTIIISQTMQYERKIIQIFKSFIEKALIPQIKRMEGSLFEWNKFNTMISAQTGYVDSLGPSIGGPVTFQRKQLPKFPKKREDDQQRSPTIGGGFNPSKTFGGDRVRMMFPIKNDSEESSNNGKEWSFNSIANRNKDDMNNRSMNNGNSNPQTLLPGLEKMAKLFSQTQFKLQSMLEGITGLSSGPYTSQFVPNKSNY